LKSSAKNVKLASIDDLFTTEQERQETDVEKVVRVPLSELHYFKGYPAMQTEIPFTGQPYRVKDDDPKMLETLESVTKRGVRTPALVRPDPDGGYEIISGHRRHRASELAGLMDMPVIIREMTDEEAVIELVDANIQREDVLPSEKAWAYRMKLEAIKRQGERTDLTSSQVGMKLQTLEIVGKEAGDSRNQVHRYIRLTELIPELLSMVDEKKIALNPAYELSFLKKDEQTMLLDAMDSEQATPSLSQAQRLKKFSQEGRLSEDSMLAIMSEEKKGDLDKVTFTGDKLRKYFPKSYTPQQMEQTILKLLEQWQKKRQREQER
jgi:ParB family chromosome partitioning protein